MCVGLGYRVNNSSYSKTKVNEGTKQLQKISLCAGSDRNFFILKFIRFGFFAVVGLRADCWYALHIACAAYQWYRSNFELPTKAKHNIITAADCFNVKSHYWQYQC